MDVEIEQLIKSYVKKFKKYQEDVDNEREATEKKVVSSLRDLTNLYQKAQVAQEDDWRSKLQENREKYSTLESSHQQLEEKITRMENNLQRKKEELKKTTTEFKEMESNIEQLKLQHKEELAALKMKVKEVNSSKKDVSKNLEALETENVKFKSDLKAATERYHQDTNSMKNDLQESKLQVASLEKRLRTVQGRERGLTEEVERKHKLTCELSNKLLDVESKCNQLSSERNQLNEQLKKQERLWQQKLKNADEEKCQLEADKTKLEEKIERKEKNLQERFQDLETFNAQLATEKRRMEREASQRETELLTLVENIEAELVRANSKTQRCEEMMMSQEKHLKAQIEDVENRRCKVQIENDKLRDEMKTVKDETANRVQELERERHQLSSEVKKLKLDMTKHDQATDMKIKKLESDIATHHAEKVDLVKSCDAKEPIIEEQSQKILEQATTIGMLQERIKALDKQLSETIAGKHDQLYKERKQMKKAEEEKLTKLLEANVAMETKAHQLEMQLSEIQLQKKSLERKITRQNEIMQKLQESAEREYGTLEEKLKEKLEQEKSSQEEKQKLEEQVDMLKLSLDDHRSKLERRDLEIKEVMIKNMDLRTDLKHAQNKTSNKAVLLSSELREKKKKLQEAEDTIGVMEHTEKKLKERMNEEQSRHSEMEQSLHQEIHQLKENIRQLQSAADDHETDHNAEMKQLTAELEIARRRIGDKEVALEEITTLEMKAQEKIIEIEEAKETEIKRCKKEVSQLLKELDETKREAERNRAEMSVDLSELESELSKVNRKLKTAETTINKLKESEDHVRSKVISLEETNRMADQERTEFQELKEKHQTLHARLASQAEQNVTKLAGLERSIHILQNGKAELESNLETEITEKEMLKKELITLRNKTNGGELLQAECSVLQEKLDTMEKDNMKKVSELQDLVEETRSTREDLQAEVTRLKRSEDKLKQLVTRLEKDLDDKEEVYKCQIKILQDEKKTLQSTLKDSKGQSSSEVVLLRLEIDTLQQEGQRTELEKERLRQKLMEAGEDKERLESEAEKMKLETQRMEQNLQRMMEDKHLLETEIERVQQEMERREGKMKRINNEMERINQENKQMKHEKLDIDAEVVKLRKKLTDFEEREEANEGLQKEIVRYQEENRDLKVACENAKGQSSSGISILQSELRTLRRREEDKERALAEMRTTEQRLKKQLMDFDIKNCQEKDAWQQTVSQLEEEKRRLEKDLKNAKATETVTAINNELREVKGELEILRNNYKSLEEKDQRSLKRLREAEAALAKEKDNHSSEMQSFSAEVSRLRRDLDAVTKEKRSLLSERCSIQAKVSDFTEVSREKDEIQMRASKLDKDLKQVQSDKHKVEVLLAEEKKSLEEKDSKISDLQTTCAMLEEQISDLETLSERLEANLRESLQKCQDMEKRQMEEKTNQEKMVEEMKQETETNKEKILALEKKETELIKTREDEKKAHEDAVRQLEDEKDEMSGDLEHWQEQSENYREQALQLARQLGDMQTQSASMEEDLRSLKEKFAEEQKDSNQLSMELASIVNKFENTKATNFKLTSCLEKAIETGEELKGERSNLESQVNNLQSHYSVEKMKLQGMMSQQTKLIDYLQTKIDAPSKKKKKKLFGKSSKDKPSAENMLLPLQYKELQDMLDYERAKNNGLEKVLDETRKELQAAKSASLKTQSVHSSSHLSLSSDISMSSALSDATTVLSAIVLSPSNQPSPDSFPSPGRGAFNRSKRKKVSQNARASKRIKERMKHNIPHRFANILNMKPTKCSVCVDTVHFGRHASKCQECHQVCHPKCASALPHTCGLPFQFVKHFSKALHEQTDSPVSTFNSSSESSILMRSQGWMKVQGSLELGWDKKWVTLDGPHLLIFNRENMKETTKPWKTFDLQPKEGWVSIHAGIIPAELPNTVPSDLSFVIRLEHHRTSQSYFPSEDTTLYLMAPTFPEKQRWVAVLENVVAMNGFGGAELKRATASINTNTLLSLEQDNKLDINCTMILNDELLLLGCDEGLYAMNLERMGDSVAHLLGVGSIYQMKYIPQLVSVIIIAGELRKLGFIESSHLTTQAKSAFKKDSYIKCTSIQNIEACHLFAVEEINNSIYLCAAQPQKIVILKYNYEKNNFMIKKEIPTAEPCSCLIFSQAGKLLAGMDRFYEVELKQFKTDEFLDSNDPTLAHAINSSSIMNSFPVAALQVASSGGPEEFLLCFHEFALFVDAKGKRTREEDLEWSRLPLCVSFRAPYLYITHFNCLEVLEIKPFADKERIAAHTFMELPNPRFTGNALSEGAVYVTSNYSQKTELICLQGNLVDSSSEQSETTVDMEDEEDTPKAAPTKPVVRRSSRISLKRTLEESSDLSTSKQSRRTLSNASSQDDSFRAAIGSTFPRRSSRLAGTSSSEDEVHPACGSVKLFTRRSNQGRRSRQAKC